MYYIELLIVTNTSYYPVAVTIQMNCLKMQKKILFYNESIFSDIQSLAALKKANDINIRVYT